MVEKAQLVELDTKVDCGPLVVEFYLEGANDLELNPALFTVQDPDEAINSDYVSFSVNE